MKGGELGVEGGWGRQFPRGLTQTRTRVGLGWLCARPRARRSTVKNRRVVLKIRT